MSSTLAAVTGTMSQVVAAIALVSGGLALAVTRRPALALGILLDLLVAAGLLRLVGDPGWRTVATVAIVIAIRHLVTYGLRLGARSWKETRKRRPDRTRQRYDDSARHLLRPAWRR
ncbi:Protein of unknown function [Blastococcus sp. DSM 46786]|uniref:DUF1622 domain-containing protein n=1 Tax=Blastococcus sp. DSM 46786 TaxID=1798227 RepID=UPI0008AEE49E|nr:DUF1622 domain-containing protein [Blastococcus sp. DSM 46786]SEK64959.1 Protein of unknown function [Blastococcus sp. DSM 46786]